MDDAEILISKDKETDEKTENEVNNDRSIARPRQRAVASNDGSYSCDECEKSFNDRSNMRKHKKSKHEGETSIYILHF